MLFRLFLTSSNTTRAEKPCGDRPHTNQHVVHDYFKVAANLLLEDVLRLGILQSLPEGDAVDAKQSALLQAGSRRQPLLRQEVAENLERKAGRRRHGKAKGGA